MPTLQHLLSHHARYRSELPCLTFGDQSLSYNDFNDQVNQLANALLGAGLRKGDAFATLLPNSVELMAAYWAAAANGLVIVPCSVLLQSSGIRTLLSDSEARLVLVEQSLGDSLLSVTDHLPALEAERIISVGGPVNGVTDYPTFVSNAVADQPGVEIDPDDVYNIMYSSGTTGAPKGIIHTHRIRSMYCTLFASAWRMTPESVVLHAGAIVFNGAMLDLMPWMYLGCHYILHPKFDPERVIADVEKYQVTHLVMVPAQIIAILNSPAFDPEKLASVEMLHNVGAPLHLPYKQRINNQLPNRFYELYGVTEGFMTILDRTESVRKAGSVGKPAAFTEIRILGEDNQFCAANEIGEICGRGPLVMPGYHNRPDLTEQAFFDGWLRSGDLGYLDDEGYLYLVDRKKDMIISGGVNVYPKDIEEIVARHSAVREVAVFGIADDRWGEVPVAAVTCSAPLATDELVNWVNKRVDAKFQRLGGAWVLDEFPRNVAGKILKRELQAEYQRSSNPEPVG